LAVREEIAGRRFQTRRVRVAAAPRLHSKFKQLFEFWPAPVYVEAARAGAAPRDADIELA